MKIRWRKGLGDARPAERFAILDAEQKARRAAVESVCSERCAQHPIGLADCTDVRVWGVRMRWGRHRKHLYVVIKCYVNPGFREFEFMWRVKVR